MPIELTRLTPTELRNLLENSRRLHDSAIEADVLREIQYRGAAMADRGYNSSAADREFQWNQNRVDEVMVPFVTVSSQVPGNRRTCYTRAGGKKIARTGTQHRWVDSYTAIKNLHINAVFGCEITRPGDSPIFTQSVSRDPQRQARPAKTYNADQLPQALIEWRDIARSAGASV